MERWRQYRHSPIYRKRSRPPQRRRRLSRGMVISIGATVAVAALGWLVLVSPVFRVVTVRAEGELTPPVTAAIEALAGQNVFRISERQLRLDLLVVEPTVADVRLTRGLPNELRVLVSRRHPTLVWQTDEGVWAVDEFGVVFGFDETLAVGIPRLIDRRHPVVTPGTELVPADFVAFATAAFAALPERIGGRVSEGEVTDTLVSLRIGTESGWSVYLDTRRPLVGQLENLNLVLREYREQIHEYVDLRVPGWGYVK